MEKRVKAHSLAGLLWGYLLAAGALCIAVCFAALFSFQLRMNCGIILPASAGSEAAAQGAALAAGHTAASFPAGELPELCRWAVFSSPQADAAVLCTNMDAWHLEKARNAQRGGSGNLGYTQYHTVVPLADGAVAYFQYDYAVPYANPALRGKLPDFQAMFLAATALACLGGVVAVNGAKIVALGAFVVVLVLLHNLAGFGLGYFVTGKLGMGKPQQHSVTLEVGMQNDALALSICAVYFAPAVAIPAAVGAAVHQITGSFLAGLFARNMDRYEARQKAAEEASVAVGD